MTRQIKGYYKNKNNRYNVEIKENGKRKYLGVYDTEEEASEIYRIACEDRLRRSVETYGHYLNDGVIYKNNYVVFDNSDIFNIKGIKLKPGLSTSEYLTVRINGYTESVHRIVAKCFVKNPHNKPFVNHIDGDKFNNQCCNLEWVNNAENMTHAYVNGLSKSGEEHRCSKLTKKDIEYIRNNYIPGDRNFGQHALSRKFKLSRSAIEKIVQNRSWKYV